MYMNNGNGTPMLFPYEPEEFWNQVRAIIREELDIVKDITKVDGLTTKPLLRISEICTFFQVSKPTVYSWINHGDLKPYRIRRNVYFIWTDVQKLLQAHPDHA